MMPKPQRCNRQHEIQRGGIQTWRTQQDTPAGTPNSMTGRTKPRETRRKYLFLWPWPLESQKSCTRNHFSRWIPDCQRGKKSRRRSGRDAAQLCSSMGFASRLPACLPSSAPPPPPSPFPPSVVSRLLNAASGRLLLFVTQQRHFSQSATRFRGFDLIQDLQSSLYSILMFNSFMVLGLIWNWSIPFLFYFENAQAFVPIKMVFLFIFSVFRYIWTKTGWNWFSLLH